MKKTISIYIALLAILPCVSKAQKVTLSTELRQLNDLSLLPKYRSGTVESEASTYDRRGGNDDGGNGTYSFVRRNPDSSLVMLDVDGPGVLNRFWTPTPTKDTIDFYVDHAIKPQLSICYMDLFNGKVYPFITPLCGSAVGGYYAYFPILFQKHLLVVCRGKRLRYHQLQYRLFPAGTKVQPFELPLNATDRDALAKVSASWTNEGLTGDITKTRLTIGPGETKTLYQSNKGGRINGLQIDTAGTSDLRLRITWENESLPAIDCPLRDFFGYAFGLAAMRGLVCGTRSFHYCYFPMPFDRSAKIEVVNEGRAAVNINARISYEAKKRNVQTEGRFYAQFTSEHLTQKEPFHVFLNIKGKGHYVGTILTAIGDENGMTGFFEGDDTTATDGVGRLHGTGSEDYFNGGWYDMQGRWNHMESKPLSGCLGYGHEPAHTGGYRFFISDKIPFEQSFWSGIEHGDSATEGIPATYTSVSFYYCDRGKAAQQTTN